MTAAALPPRLHASLRPLLRAAFTLGVALSGFFDGILLHQVLQWHHLLSLVPGETFEDPRVQILADGLFHALTYAIAVAGLWLLWRARVDLSAPSAGRALLGGALLGFGAWNVADVVLFHWILHIHRIRLDTDNRLAYDVGWLIVLGLAPIVLGWLVARRGGASGPGRGAIAAASIILAVTASGALSLRQPDGAFTTVMFQPGVSQDQVMMAVARADARLVASDPSGQLVVLQLPQNADRWALYRDGALIVGGATAAACATWALPAERRA